MTGGNLRNLLAEVADWSPSASAWEETFTSRIPLDQESARRVARIVVLAPEAVSLLTDMADALANACSANHGAAIEIPRFIVDPLLARFGRLDQQAGQ